MNEKVTAESYTLRDEQGNWLGQVILTSDGMFASVTDWGNLSFAWRAYGPETFKEFLIGLNVPYFGGKMYQGNTYILYSKRCEQACMKFAEKILPALKKVLKDELANQVK